MPYIIIAISVIIVIMSVAVRMLIVSYVRGQVQGKSVREQLTGQTEEEMYYEKHGYPTSEDRISTRVFTDEEE